MLQTPRVELRLGVPRRSGEMIRSQTSESWGLSAGEKRSDDLSAEALAKEEAIQLKS